MPVTRAPAEPPVLATPPVPVVRVPAEPPVDTTPPVPPPVPEPVTVVPPVPVLPPVDVWGVPAMCTQSCRSTAQVKPSLHAPALHWQYWSPGLPRQVCSPVSPGPLLLLQPTHAPTRNTIAERNPQEVRRRA